jgi:hypothetical protein
MTLDSLQSGQLINRPRPYIDESISGYLLRVAEANDYDQPAWILSHTATPANFAIKPTDFSALASLVDMSVEDLEARCYWPVGKERSRRDRKFRGLKVPDLMINRSRPRICPRCVKEDGYVQALWDLAPVACCPTHGIQLIDCCWHCNAPIKWNRKGVSECHRCQSSLLEASVSSAPESAISITVMIARKTGFETLSVPDPQGMPADLERLDLGVLLRVIAFLGGSKLGKRQGEGRWLPARLTIPEMIEVVSSAAEVFTDWPKNYFVLLDEIRNRSETMVSGAGLEREFGGFYLALANSLRRQGAGFLWNAFEEYVATQWDGGFVCAKNTRVQQDRRHSERFVTRAKAARQLGIRPERIDRLVSGGLLKGIHRRQRERNLLLVETDSIEEYRSSRGNQISLKDACARLGLSKTAVLQLVRKRLLRPIWPHKGGMTVYEAKNVDELLDAALKQSGALHPVKSRHISLPRAMRRLTSVGLNSGDLVLAMLSGTLPVVGRDECLTGLAQCLFRPADVASLVEEQSEKNNGVMTIPEAANALGLKQQCTYDLVKAGLLETSFARVRNRVVRTVCEDAINRFSKTYVSASELAIREQASPRQVVTRLKAQGVKPATGPCVDGLRQYFFLRSATQNGASIA